MEKQLVVGVMGAGHALHGFDVTHQLHDLGFQNVAVFAVGQRQILQKSRESCGGCRVWRSTQCFRDHFKTNEWTWTGWRYTDGTTLTQNNNQMVNFAFLSVLYSWQ